MHHVTVCDPVSLSAAFAVGLAGSVHCVAMCGGIAGALGLRARHASTARRASVVAGAYQIGRLVGYTLAGALVGAFGSVMQGFVDPERAMLVARCAAGLVLISVGTGIVFQWRPLAVLERLGGGLWRRIAPLARAIPPGGISGSLLLGLLWGWLPCGFVYSMLIFAALKGGVIQAAALMLFFGLGTVPALLGWGMVSTHAARLGWLRGLHTTAGWLVMVFGAMTILSPLGHARP